MKLDLTEIRENKLKGHIIRSKVKWIDEGEKPSNFFSNLNKRNYLNKTILKLELGNGETISSQKDILKEMQFFIRHCILAKMIK